MSTDKLRFDLHDGIARITLANVGGRNAVDASVTTGLREAAIRCETAPDLRCVLLSAEGPYFSVGGDLQDFLQHRANVAAHVRGMTVDFHAAIGILHRLPAPLVVAVNGTAAGGGVSLVCMSDIAIASRAARFNFAYTRSGLTPDGGATWFLPRLVGAQRAFDLLATNPSFTAEEAQRMGLLARVVDEADFAPEVEALVRRLADAPAGAVGRLKLQLRQSARNSLAEQLELEGAAIAAQARHPDTLAMLDAFLAKSAPRT
jgi:2-(1,2-epoxy-1,2-dihydrophenyl)acetyl-CoA isomerase